MNRSKKSSPVLEIKSNASPRGLRVSEAATYLGSTVTFVRHIIAEREVPALRLGKRHILLREDLDEFLDAQRRRA